MLNINRNVILHTMVLHETLTIHDIVKVENLGITLNMPQTQSILEDLQGDGHIDQLNDVIPATYTITVKGIEAFASLSDADKKELKEIKAK